MQECEAVLAAEPGAPEMLAMLGEIEAKLQRRPTKPKRKQTNCHTARPMLPEAGADGWPTAALLEIGGRNSGKPLAQSHPKMLEQGNDQLAKFLIVQQMFSEDEVKSGPRSSQGSESIGQGQASGARRCSIACCKGNDGKMEAVLSALIDRTKFAYVPLEYYDIDRQVARMLPDDLTMSRLFVPFDLDQPHDHGGGLQSI